MSHPDNDTVVWELDFAGLAPACDEAFRHLDGFMRLTFDRAEYESDVRAMLRELQRTAREPVPFGQLAELRWHCDLEKEYPGCRHAVADLFEPTIHGECDSDEFLELDAAAAAWPREAIFPSGTVIEIGCFGQDLYRVNGKRSHGWIGQWFTRWQALSAFRLWLRQVSRRFTFGVGNYDPTANPNEFVLASDTSTDAAHSTGAEFAKTLHACLAEGNTAPGVEVRYERSNIPLP